MSATKIAVGASGIVAEVAGRGFAVMALPSVPADGATGYGHGCIVVNLGGTTAYDALYINVGTSSSCNFDPLDATAIQSALFSSTLRSYPIPINQVRVWDDFDSFLPETAASDDLGLLEGTFLSSAPTLVTSDFGGTNIVAQYGRFQFPVPPTYVAGQPITLTVNTYMQVVADDTVGIDAEVVRVAAPSTDICASAGSDINTATTTNLETFTITPTNVVVGDILDVRLSIGGQDAGDAAPNIRAVIKGINLNFTTKEPA